MPFRLFLLEPSLAKSLSLKREARCHLLRQCVPHSSNPGTVSVLIPSPQHLKPGRLPWRVTSVPGASAPSLGLRGAQLVHSHVNARLRSLVSLGARSAPSGQCGRPQGSTTASSPSPSPALIRWLRHSCSLLQGYKRIFAMRFFFSLPTWHYVGIFN